MKHNKIEQIKALLETGFTERQVKDILDATDDELLMAMGVEEPAEEPAEEVKEETEEERSTEKRLGMGPKFQKEQFEEAKKLQEEGYSTQEIAKKLGFSAPFIYSIISKNTYDDVIEWREKQAAYKRDAYRRKKLAKQAKQTKQKPQKQLADAVSSMTGKAFEMADDAFKITKTVAVEKPIEELRPELIEFRSMADSLERIAEAFEKIAEQPKKRGLFGR